MYHCLRHSFVCFEIVYLFYCIILCNSCAREQYTCLPLLLSSNTKPMPSFIQSKGLRERWLLDGAPSGGAEEDETQQRLRADEIKTKLLEHSVVRQVEPLNVEPLNHFCKASHLRSSSH